MTREKCWNFLVQMWTEKSTPSLLSSLYLHLSIPRVPRDLTSSKHLDWRHPNGQPYVPHETRPIQIKIEQAPTTKANGISTTGWDDLIIQGQVTAHVMKLIHFDEHSCKWTGFVFELTTTKVMATSTRKKKTPIPNLLLGDKADLQSAKSWKPPFPCPHIVPTGGLWKFMQNGLLLHQVTSS